MAQAVQANDPRLPLGTDFVGKFALDVILFNLQACGYERRFVLKNDPGTGYTRPNFVRIAAVSVLRLCLTYRDKWRLNIQQLARSTSVYDAAFFAKCLCHIVERAQNEGKDALQLNVEISLALSNEMALYLISKNKQFDLMALVGSATTNIFCLIETPIERAFKQRYCPSLPPVNFKQELEKLFSEFENIWEILRWIEDFIKKYAVPYGSRADVSAIFYREAGKRWKDIVERVFHGEKPLDEAVQINLGFLPKEAYDKIVAEMSVSMPKYSEVAWGRKGGKKSSGKQSTASGSTSKQTAQGGPSSEDSSQSTKGGQSSKDSSKQTTKGGQSSKASSKRASQGSKDSSEQAAQGSKDSSEQAAQGSKDSSEQAVQGGKDSSEKAVQGGKDSSEQAVQGGESTKLSPDSELAAAFSRICLSGSEKKTQASQGAIQKVKK